MAGDERKAAGKRGGRVAGNRQEESQKHVALERNVVQGSRSNEKGVYRNPQRFREAKRSIQPRPAARVFDPPQCSRLAPHQLRDGRLGKALGLACKADTPSECGLNRRQANHRR